FTGNWSSPGAETSWDSDWRYSGELGSVTWDGDNHPLRDGLGSFDYHAPFEQTGISEALSQFVNALKTNTTPMGEVHENIESLAIVQAALESSRTKQIVIVDDLLERALESAIKENEYPELMDFLNEQRSKELKV
ncbi:MAG TPA: hypothetical protein VIH79_04640, partial [Candidatus Nanopelagicaceae bacterium]